MEKFWNWQLQLRFSLELILLYFSLFSFVQDNDIGKILELATSIAVFFGVDFALFFFIFFGDCIIIIINQFFGKI